MRTMIAALVLGVLGGCAMNAAELRESGKRITLTSLNTPPEIADCAVRQAPDVGQGLLAQTRERTPQRADIVLFYGAQLAATFVVSSATAGSTIDAYLWPYMLPFEEERVMGAIKGC